MANRFDEMEQEIKFLRGVIKEMQDQYLWIRREPVTTAPTAMASGNMVIYDDGTANPALYYQASTGIKSVSMT